jgi:hypothetical protein
MLSWMQLRVNRGDALVADASVSTAPRPERLGLHSLFERDAARECLLNLQGGLPEHHVLRAAVRAKEHDFPGPGGNAGPPQHVAKSHAGEPPAG